MSLSRRSSNCETNMFGWSALESANHCSILSLEGICPTQIPFWNAPDCQFLGPLLLRLLGNAFLTIWLVCGIGHNTWLWNGRVCIFQACCPRLDRAWSSSFTNHTFSPQDLDQSVTLQEEWGQSSSQFAGRFLSSFLRGWAHVFTSPWLGTSCTLFFDLQLRTILWCMLLNTPYSQSEIASFNGWMSLKPYRSWRILYLRKTLHALRLVDPFLLPEVARCNGPG